MEPTQTNRDYEIDFFGDLVLHAIAKGCQKNILIFNTSVAAYDPVYVVEASKFGGIADSDIPVVVCYNQVHYESLHPTTIEDIDKTKLLVTSYLNGIINITSRTSHFLLLHQDKRR